MKDRFFLRWVTEADPATGRLRMKGWDVCDDGRFDCITVQSFGVHEKEQAEGLCRLLNSIEEE